LFAMRRSASLLLFAASLQSREDAVDVAAYVATLRDSP
jgi:hypothetical protein